MVGFRCFCGLGVVPRRSFSFSGVGFRRYWFRVFCVVKVFGIGGGLVVMVFVGGGSERGSVVVEATRCCVGTSGGGKKGLLVLVWMGVDGWGRRLVVEGCGRFFGSLFGVGAVGYGGGCLELSGSGVGGWRRSFLGLGFCPGMPERARYVDSPC
jgi:hypothetical protein